ncbi:hypothetical protein COO60DRAFT_1535228 [Scenedesmus sp. NREL 46B-D3]|nr:hypothetical protein COO60DRAFT_1535228 [Scenedesmus sp. NREL 46B-D3]
MPVPAVAINSVIITATAAAPPATPQLALCQGWSKPQCTGPGAAARPRARLAAGIGCHLQCTYRRGAAAAAAVLAALLYAVPLLAAGTILKT